MAQYIDKAAVVAEIENRIKELQNLQEENKAKLDSIQKTSILLCIDECKVILSLLDTLETKDVYLEKATEKNLWKTADGEDLPEIGREVVAFQEIFPTNVDVPSLFKIVVAHRPNPKGYDGKSIATGEVEHYTPKTYGKGGWNIPDVRFWLDCSMPKEIEQ